MSQSIVLAIDIGGKSIKTGLMSKRGLIHVFDPVQLPNTLDAPAFFALLRRRIDENLELAIRQNQRPTAIGIGIPGIVDGQLGIAYATTNLPWTKTNFQETLESWTGLPTFVEHDVRSGAIAEAAYGALQGCQDYLYVAIGTGIGAGISIRNTLYSGSSGFGGELGHTIVIPNGRPCDCGRKGCLEAYCSAKQIERRYHEETGQLLSCKDIAGVAVNGDEHAVHIWDEAAGALALALLNYHILLQPEAIVIGGGVAEAGSLLLQPTIQRMQSFSPGIELPTISFSKLKQHSALIGAGYQAIVRGERDQS